jgi:signal transduction histidine kinase
VWVGLGAAEAAAAVDALLGNVFGHTPDGTAYDITLAVVPAGARLWVDDAGPGIPDPEAVLARGHSSARSTGLGLDIARRAAEAAGGHLALSRSDLGGARVELTFPLAGSPGR